MNFKEYFNRAMTIDAYTPLLADKAKLHEHHYCRTEFDEDREALCKRIGGLQILCLTEPWCGDSLAILPVLQKLADSSPGSSMRILLRDKNLDLMDLYLTRGGRAVPIVFFLDNKFNLLFKWGPRPNAAQEIFEINRQQIIDGRVKKEDVTKKIRKFYSLNRGRAILDEISQLVKKNGPVNQSAI